MRELEKEISKIIDEVFDFKIKVTGNKLQDQLNKSKKIEELSETSLDKCIDFLNTKHPEQAKSIADSGFIGKYIKEKQKFFLLS
ncbi:hypothetical protein K5I29_04035 [Flavobacterium agricola]|uniref:Uncharacterized protein n=1 Tax=Flavobacterium agricola TaxID=2870839 RepID=A0ABY6M4H8_9FLAO|nr:hypothetical protein [Flavobacterium agricola]UYW02078.1 hypothetical protein K5I29_04035 [Flavobacterium agricola]